jgi:hypothetical protein
MSLIKRGDKQYLIRSIRRNGRVTSQYIASGDRAVQLHKAYRVFAPKRPDPYDLWAERQDKKEHERAARKAKRKAARVRKRAEDLEASIRALADEAKTLAREMMRATGHHQVRWTWRKKRGVDVAKIKMDVDELMRKLEAKLNTIVSEKTMVSEENTEMTKEERAKRDEEIKAEVAFSRTPEGISATVDKWAAYDSTRPDGKPSVVKSVVVALRTDPTREIVEQLVCEWSNGDIPRELLRRQYRRMLDELLGSNPTIIERHLAERVMVCWLDLHVSERIAINLHTSLNWTPAEKGYFQTTRDRAHKRYVDTLRALALVRQRALPALKLSLAVQDGKSGAAAIATVESSDQISGAEGHSLESPENLSANQIMRE